MITRGRWVWIRGWVGRLAAARAVAKGNILYSDYGSAIAMMIFTVSHLTVCANSSVFLGRLFGAIKVNTRKHIN